MIAVFRYFLPITYFRATRLNRWELVGYNALIEWIPAIGLSLYFNAFNLPVLATVIVSYLAFISVYEIGYITNDFYSERFESAPRGRLAQLNVTFVTICILIGTRILVFIFATNWLGAWKSNVWWAFYAGLVATFLLHNLIPSEARISTFFALSTFRYFAPIILTLGGPILTVLLPAVLLNNSLYRVTVYTRNKAGDETPTSSRTTEKLIFYLGCIPLSTFFAIYFESYLPLLLCFYHLGVWAMFWTSAAIRTRSVAGSIVL